MPKMEMFTSEKIKEFVSKPLFDEKVILSKDPSWPKISIVTPSFNQAEFIEMTILSVLNQNYPNLEYIIMDGGSNDGSVDIIRQYGKFLTYWVSEKDNGQADAIAKGFSFSTGDVLGWLNSDDLLLPNALLTISRSIDQNQSWSFIAGSCVYLDESSKPSKSCVPMQRSWKMMLLMGHGLAQMSTFWKREAYNSVGGLDVSLQFSFDYDLFVRLRKQGEMKIVPNYLAAFRLHGSSKTSNQIQICKAEDKWIRKKYGAWYMSMPGVSFFSQLNPIHRIINSINFLKYKKSFNCISN